MPDCRRGYVSTFTTLVPGDVVGVEAEGICLLSSEVNDERLAVLIACGPRRAEGQLRHVVDTLVIQILCFAVDLRPAMGFPCRY